MRLSPGICRRSTGGARWGVVDQGVGEAVFGGKAGSRLRSGQLVGVGCPEGKEGFEEVEPLIEVVSVDDVLEGAVGPELD